MSNKTHTDSPAATLKNDDARQRWELFHRAIAHAKRSNVSELQDAEEPRTDGKQSTPILSIVR